MCTANEECTIQKAKRLGLPDTLCLYFPEGSLERYLVFREPGLPIWYYEHEANKYINWAADHDHSGLTHDAKEVLDISQTSS